MPMEYTGKHKRKYSSHFRQEIDILEYRSKDKIPYTQCDICGKNIVGLMYVIQDPNTDNEIAYVGSTCINKI